MHFLHTDNGLKMIRYFILPESVYELFNNQPILGEPMIKQLVMTTLPDQFDETDTNLEYAFDFTTNYRYGDRTAEQDRASLANLLTTIHPESAGYRWYGREVGFGEWGRFGHRAFVSFHPWPLYETVRQTGESSIVQALANFDRFLLGGMVKHDLPKRELPTGNATLYLPPRTG